MQVLTNIYWIKRTTICALLFTLSFFAIEIQHVTAQGVDKYTREQIKCRKAFCEPTPKIPCCWEYCAVTACTKSAPWDSIETACSPQSQVYQSCMINYQKKHGNRKSSINTVPKGFSGLWEMGDGLWVRFSNKGGELAGYVAKSAQRLKHNYPKGSLIIKHIYPQRSKRYGAKLLVYKENAKQWTPVILEHRGNEMVLHVGPARVRCRKVGS